MQIKTIWSRIDSYESFDARVNKALADGWTLVKREVLPGESYNENNWGCRLLYAELVKGEAAPPGAMPQVDNVFHAAGIVKACCDSHDGCTKCELLAVCAARSPHCWRDPEVGV